MPSAPAPDAHVQPGGRDAAAAHLEAADRLAGQRMLDLRPPRGRTVRRRRPRRCRRRSRRRSAGGRRSRRATASAARPFPVPPVSSLSARGAPDRAARVIDLDVRASAPAATAPQAGAAAPPRAPRASDAGTDALRESPHSRLPRSRATSVGSTRPPVRSAAHTPAATAVRSSADAGTSERGSRVERAELAVGAKAREPRREVLDVARARARPPRRRSRRSAPAAPRRSAARRCPSNGSSGQPRRS